MMPQSHTGKLRRRGINMSTYPARVFFLNGNYRVQIRFTVRRRTEGVVLSETLPERQLCSILILISPFEMDVSLIFRNRYWKWIYTIEI